MEDFSYITVNLAKILAERPGHMVTILEYACLFTLLIAMVSEVLMRRRKRAARQEPPVVDRVPVKPGNREASISRRAPSQVVVSNDSTDAPAFEQETDPDSAPECGCGTV